MQSFEKSINRLDEIVSDLQSGKLTLDQSLKVFEEGASLVAACNKMLDQAEQKVMKISESGEAEEFIYES